MPGAPGQPWADRVSKHVADCLCGLILESRRKATVELLQSLKSAGFLAEAEVRLEGTRLEVTATPGHALAALERPAAPVPQVIINIPKDIFPPVNIQMPTPRDKRIEFTRDDYGGITGAKVGPG